jgi:uncharacterized membrane protein YqjE
MKEVPKILRTLFVVHFVADISFAVPLLVAPEFFLRMLGWTTVDPFAARLVAAALFGIGTESLLARNAPLASYLSMLSLKIIWSVMAIAGMGLTVIQYPRFRTAASAAFIAVFVVFNIVWSYWKIRLGRSEEKIKEYR